MDPIFYAHINENGQHQTVETHLAGTAARCASFAAEFGEEERGRLLGQAHDIGKCSREFQKRLLQNGPKVDHATAGALECARLSEDLAACCIIGHHGGLPNFGNPRIDPAGAPTCVGRLKKGRLGLIPEYHWDKSLPAPVSRPQFQDTYTLSVWLKMLYSSLVDADYLDTEAFMRGSSGCREQYDPLPVLAERLEAYIKPWFPAKTELNRIRCEVLTACRDAGSKPRGLYALTVPTGGGKTIASLAFALRHAIANGMKRIIYVIPYTSIIEQNAAVFRGILGENNVVEHHSGVHFDEDGETGGENCFQRLASENWDAPVIVTTSVQFFESFYANRPSQCRKLHNVANSVVIFDEAQMLPSCHLRPCTGVIANLVAHFRTSVVLCTATQPVLDDLIHTFSPGLPVTELVPKTEELFARLRRVTYRNGGLLTADALCWELQSHAQVLCVVNTRKATQKIFHMLPQEGSFHLSTLMYPAHRKAVLAEIRRRLDDGDPCRVVSTSLIEAGVDVDFPAVYRELAGLDSIVQAAGRCNRNGKHAAEESIVTWFESGSPAPLLQRINIAAAKEVLADGLDPGDPDCIRRYFAAWRSLADERLDKSNAVEYLRNGLQGCLLPFETVAQNFRLINQDTKTIYIPWEDGAELCQRLLSGNATRADYRKAGSYCVSVYEPHFQSLFAGGYLALLDDDSAVLTDLSLYDRQTGLSLDADSGKAEFI